MDGRIFDGLIHGLLMIGAAIGVALCGAVWFLWWLFHHLTFSWR
jgi:hypothetical protein